MAISPVGTPDRDIFSPVACTLSVSLIGSIEAIAPTPSQSWLFQRTVWPAVQ